MKNGQNLLELKLKRISSGQRFKKKLLPVRKTFSLNKGTLDCRIADEEITLPLTLTEPGLNTYRIKIHYETADSGPITRIGMASVHVGHGKADPKQSSVRAIRALRGKTRRTQLNVTPRNATGQLLGPGKVDELSIFIGRKKAEYTVRDLLDGTYRFELLPGKKLATDRHPVSIKHMDKIFWEGAIEL